MNDAATEVKRGAAWRKHGPFCLAPAGAILPTCLGLSSSLSLDWRTGWD
jgi:hypothetical protein